MKSSRRPLCAVAIAMMAIFVIAFAERAAEARTSVRSMPGFIAIDIYIDAGTTPLAAYQFDFSSPGAKLVGVEGGEHAAFSAAPYYDPAALANEGVAVRGELIIVAAFSTDRDLPVGRTRIARLHVQAPANAPIGEEVRLVTAAGADGKEIKAQVEAVRVVPGTQNDKGDAR